MLTSARWVSTQWAVYVCIHHSTTPFALNSSSLSALSSLMWCSGVFLCCFFIQGPPDTVVWILPYLCPQSSSTPYFQIRKWEITSAGNTRLKSSFLELKIALAHSWKTSAQVWIERLKFCRKHWEPKKCCQCWAHYTGFACTVFHYLYGRGGQGEVVSYPPSALIFCELWKILLQESNCGLGTAWSELFPPQPTLPPFQLTLFDTSEAGAKSVSDAENALI